MARNRGKRLRALIGLGLGISAMTSAAQAAYPLVRVVPSRVDALRPVTFTFDRPVSQQLSVSLQSPDGSIHALTDIEQPGPREPNKLVVRSWPADIAPGPAKIILTRATAPLGQWLSTSTAIVVNAARPTSLSVSSVPAGRSLNYYLYVFGDNLPVVTGARLGTSGPTLTMITKGPKYITLLLPAEMKEGKVEGGIQIFQGGKMIKSFPFKVIPPLTLSKSQVTEGTEFGVSGTESRDGVLQLSWSPGTFYGSAYMEPTKDHGGVLSYQAPSADRKNVLATWIEAPSRPDLPDVFLSAVPIGGLEILARTERQAPSTYAVKTTPVDIVVLCYSRDPCTSFPENYGRTWKTLTPSDVQTQLFEQSVNPYFTKNGEALARFEVRSIRKIIGDELAAATSTGLAYFDLARKGHKKAGAVTVYVSGLPYAAGMATLNTMLTEYPTLIVQQWALAPRYSLLAHELGHILGLNHTADESILTVSNRGLPYRSYHYAGCGSQVSWDIYYKIDYPVYVYDQSSWPYILKETHCERNNVMSYASERDGSCGPPVFFTPGESDKFETIFECWNRESHYL